MALTLPSSNGDFDLFCFTSSNSDNGQVNSHFNGGLTKTTPTLTPTRLKNIEEQFREQQSLLPPKPFLHDHMAGFVPPTVNIKLQVKPQTIEQNPIAPSIIHLDLNQDLSQNSKQPIDYYSSNSNSNDSYSNQYSDGYSSETNSSTTVSTGRSRNFSFANSFLQTTTDLNSTGFVNMKNNSKSLSNMKTRSKSVVSNAISSKSSTPRTSQKKSTGGGRKPNSSQNLTPEEDLKRQKRRERNKLAAARCRKKRVDQTNDLMNQTRELKKKHDSLIKEINARLKEFQSCKELLEIHEPNCCNFKMHLLPEIYSQIDLSAINSGMEPVPDDDLDNDLNSVCYPSSSQEEFPQSSSTTTPPTPKRKRPNSLSFRPVEAMNTEPINKTIAGTGEPFINLTPSNGLSVEGGLGLDSFSLTPLNPTLTMVDLTPSTMASFLKSLSSPTEDGERKKLLSM